MVTATEEKKTPRRKRSKLLTRPEIAAEFNVEPGTITRWERDGMPVAKKTTRGRPTLFDLAAVRAWREAKDTIAPESLSLEYERARLARAQAEKTERENEVRKGQLVEREHAILEGQSYTKAWATKVRSLPSRAVQAGAIEPAQEPRLAALCRELLVEISSWRTMADTDPPPAGKRAAKKRTAKPAPKTAAKDAAA